MIPLKTEPVIEFGTRSRPGVSMVRLCPDSPFMAVDIHVMGLTFDGAPSVFEPATVALSVEFVGEVDGLHTRQVASPISTVFLGRYSEVGSARKLVAPPPGAEYFRVRWSVTGPNTRAAFSVSAAPMYPPTEEELDAALDQYESLGLDITTRAGQEEAMRLTVMMYPIIGGSK